MLKDTIDKVKAAERQADELVADARKKAETIIEQAHADAKDSKSKAKQKSEAEAAEALSTAESRSVYRTDAANANVENEIAELKAKASEKEEAAVKAVIEKLIG